MKKYISLVLVMVLLFSSTITASATSNSNTITIQPRWSYLDTVSAYININALGIATCEGRATSRDALTVETVVRLLQPVSVSCCKRTTVSTATSRDALTVETVVRLQQLTDTGWSTIKTWSSTSVGSASVSKTYAVYAGYTYRTSVTGYVYDSNGNIIETGSASDTFYY